MNERILRLRKAMSDARIDACVFYSGADRQFYSGFTGTSGIAVVTHKSLIFVTDSRYTIQAREQCSAISDEYVIVQKGGAAAVAHIAEVFKGEGISRIWVNEDMMTYSQYLALTAEADFVRVEKGAQVFQSLRASKTGDEIAIMKEAARIAGKAYVAMLNNTVVGMTELEMAAEFERQVGMFEGASCAFRIIASGENGAKPHAIPSERKIQYGDMVTVDFGVCYKGYYSDCTRTFAVGEVSHEQEKIYSIVAQAKALAQRAIRPGAVCGEIDKIARDYITEAGYGQYFGHGLGHGLGMDVHEFPRLAPGVDAVLAEGMVVTNEPGIYIEGLGGVRIEDSLLVDDSPEGHTNITADVPNGLYVKEF